MSSPIQPSGTSTPSISSTSVSASNDFPITRSTGQLEVATALAREAEHVARQLDAVRLDQGVAGGDPLGAEEAEAHRAADQEPVGGLEEPLDDANLVGHLGAAQHDAEGPRGVVAHRDQLTDLALEQEARVGGKQARHALGRRVGAVRGPERVVHIEVGERGEPARELRVVCGLAGLEAAVLEQQHLARLEVRGKRLDLGPGHPGGQGHRGPEKVGEARGDRGHRERRVEALGPVQMGDQHHRRAALAQQLDGGQRAADSRIVIDPHRRSAGR